MKFILISLILGSFSLAEAKITRLEATAEDPSYSEYFTVDEKTPAIHPNNILQGAINDLVKAPAPGDASKPLNLLRWIRHKTAPPVPTEEFNRKQHFGRWANDNGDGGCLDTRAKILVRDSVTPVTYQSQNKCLVDTGTWNDPYTGEVRKKHSEVDVDHMVPLSHAYKAGAFKWTFKKRCLYANFMANKYHLITVDSTENRSKGDSAPDEYIPPNKSFTCQYLSRWLKVKTTWKLVMFPPEVEAMKQIIEESNCTANEFKMSQTELNSMREQMGTVLNSCDKDANDLGNDDDDNQ